MTLTLHWTELRPREDVTIVILPVVGRLAVVVAVPAVIAEANQQFACRSKMAPVDVRAPPRRDAKEPIVAAARLVRLVVAALWRARVVLAVAPPILEGEPAVDRTHWYYSKHWGYSRKALLHRSA